MTVVHAGNLSSLQDYYATLSSCRAVLAAFPSGGGDRLPCCPCPMAPACMPAGTAPSGHPTHHAPIAPAAVPALPGADAYITHKASSTPAVVLQVGAPLLAEGRWAAMLGLRIGCCAHCTRGHRRACQCSCGACVPLDLYPLSAVSSLQRTCRVLLPLAGSGIQLQPSRHLGPAGPCRCRCCRWQGGSRPHCAAVAGLSGSLQEV